MSPVNALILFDIPVLAGTEPPAVFTAEQIEELRFALLADGTTRLRGIPDVHLQVAIAESTRAEAFASVFPDVEVLRCAGEQTAGQMADAIDDAFDTGFRHVLLLCSDACLVPVRTIETAFAVLDAFEDALLLGPGSGSGVYAFGMRHPHPELFAACMDPSGPSYDEAVARVREDDTAVYLLPSWPVLRRAAQWERFIEEASASAGSASSILDAAGRISGTAARGIGASA